MRFQIPAGWTVARIRAGRGDKKEDICTIRVRPSNIAELIKKNDDVDLYTIVIISTRRNFDSAAEAGYFRRKENGWIVLGRTDIESPAKEISSPKWIGLQGTATVGCYREASGYAGLCEIPRAMLNDRGTSAIFYGSPQSETEFNSILRTFEFTD